MLPVKIRCAIVAGEEAARDGLTEDDNPYSHGSPLKLVWERAYFRRKQWWKEHREFMAKLRREEAKRKKADALAR